MLRMGTTWVAPFSFVSPAFCCLSTAAVLKGCWTQKIREILLKAFILRQGQSKSERIWGCWNEILQFAHVASLQHFYLLYGCFYRTEVYYSLLMQVASPCGFICDQWDNLSYRPNPWVWCASDNVFYCFSVFVHVWPLSWACCCRWCTFTVTNSQSRKCICTQISVYGAFDTLLIPVFQPI